MMTVTEAEAAHAAEMKRIQGPGGPELDVATCKARIVAAGAALKTLEGARTDARVSFARGTSSGEDFDASDRAVGTMQRRLAALTESLPALERTVAAAYGGLHVYSRIIEDGVVAASLARRVEREKQADLRADK